jgi:cytochrome c-type biogenesis protein CcmH/NrfF
VTVRRLGGWAGSLRREFTALSAGLLLLSVYPATRLPAQNLDSLPNPGASGKLWDPARAGRPLPPVTARDNTDAIQAIEKQLRCTCGCQLDVYTCRTTDFTCTTSPAMHQQVLALETAGKSGQEIVDAFVAENGVSILMAPPRHGFNLAGYFLPGALILAAAVVLVLVLRRWTRSAMPVPSTAANSVPASPQELEQLSRALHEDSD